MLSAAVAASPSPEGGADHPARSAANPTAATGPAHDHQPPSPTVSDHEGGGGGGGNSSSSVLHFTYFAIFDGHAGTGCALWAANTLHHHIREKLGEVSHLIAQLEESGDGVLTNGATFPPFGGGGTGKKKKVRFESMNHVTADSLIQGALEKAFVLMDQQV